MKRCIIGFVLLLVLLLGGLFSSWVMARQHAPLAQQLEQAADLALEGQLARAADMSSRTREQWEKGRNFGAVLADHGPMEEIDGDFVRLEAYARAGRTAEFAALCAELSQKLQAMGDAHGLQWWNIL